MHKAMEVWNRYDAARDEGAYRQVVADLRTGGFDNQEADRVGKVIADSLIEHLNGKWDSYVNLTMQEMFQELHAKAT